MRLGCDPEVFLVDALHSTFVSVIGKVGGNKQNPLQLTGYPKGFTIQEDNVALEFCVPPSKSCAAFLKNIQMVQSAAKAKLENKYTFSTLSCVAFPKEQLAHPLANMFGCEPDYNAWTGDKNEKGETPKDLRSAGGHIHLETNLDPNKMGQALDLFLGIPSLLMDKKGEARRKYYGKAGAIRYKPYGLEYRVLSNFWIFAPKYIKWVWNQAHRAETFVKENNKVGEGVELIINAGDMEMANYLVKEYDLHVC